MLRAEGRMCRIRPGPLKRKSRRITEPPIKETSVLALSDNLFLTHSSFDGQGKTRKMAKGLILCHGHAVFAGESAGFGLPVLKTDQQTIFPSLISTSMQTLKIMDAVFHFNLINAWRIGGLAAPSGFTDAMEKMTGFYMRRPGLQSAALIIRGALFKCLRVQSTMIPGASFGYCRVRYQAEKLQLTIRVQVDPVKEPARLILLNEVPGTQFTRLVTRGEKSLQNAEGKNFLPWSKCRPGTAVENPARGIGFFLSVPDSSTAPQVEMNAGREVAKDLDWAGLSIISEHTGFTYHVNFYVSPDGHHNYGSSSVHHLVSDLHRLCGNGHHRADSSPVCR
jgi:hypothetical protein